MKWVELEMYSNCAALPNQPWIVPSKWRMNKFVVPQTIAVNWKSKSIWSKQQKLYCGPIYGVDLIVGEGFVHGFSAVFSVRRRLEHSCASINWIRNLPCFISENIFFFFNFCTNSFSIRIQIETSNDVMQTATITPKNGRPTRIRIAITIQIQIMLCSPELSSPLCNSTSSKTFRLR